MSASHVCQHHEGSSHVAKQIAADIEAFRVQGVPYPLYETFDGTRARVLIVLRS